VGLGVGGVGERDPRFIGEVVSPDRTPSAPRRAAVAAISPRDAQPPPNLVTVEPGTKMAEIERRVIEAALKETRGNRRRAAEMLGIGERTLYRKIKEYQVPEEMYAESRTTAPPIERRFFPDQLPSTGASRIP